MSPVVALPSSVVDRNSVRSGKQLGTARQISTYKKKLTLNSVSYLYNVHYKKHNFEERRLPRYKPLGYPLIYEKSTRTFPSLKYNSNVI
jgi:hypothetical protein